MEHQNILQKENLKQQRLEMLVSGRRPLKYLSSALDNIDHLQSTISKLMRCSSTRLCPTCVMHGTEEAEYRI